MSKYFIIEISYGDNHLNYQQNNELCRYFKIAEFFFKRYYAYITLKELFF